MLQGNKVQCYQGTRYNVIREQDTMLSGNKKQIHQGASYNITKVQDTISGEDTPPGNKIKHHQETRYNTMEKLQLVN